MSQTSYSQNHGEAFAGMKVDARFDTVLSKLAEASTGTGIPFGYGVVSGTDAETQVKLPSYSQSILSIDADLIASNSTIVTVNGNATTATVYATSHAATMAAIVLKVAALAGVLSATLSAARDITIVGINGVAITASAVTTAGSSQGTWTQVQSDTGVFRGVALHRHTEKAQVTGVAQYEDLDVVDVISQGVVWMPYVTGITIVVDETAYINLAIAAQSGKVTNVSSGNVTTGGKVRKVNTTLALAAIEINLP